MATRKIINKHINQSSSTYVGTDGELFYDTVTNTLKISDGTTPGGTTLTGAGGGGATLPLDNGDSRIDIATASGDVTVVADDITWTFGTDGKLILPYSSANGDPILTLLGGATPGISSDAGGGPGNFSITASQLLIGAYSSAITIQPENGEIETSADMVLTTNGSAEPTQWTLGTDGSTIFPTLTRQRGDVPSGTITGQTLLFGDDTQEAIISTPNGDANNNSSQRLVINPGYGYNTGEGGDIYLWAGRGGATNGNGGDIKIRGGAGPGNGYGGYVKIDGGDVENAGTPGQVEIKGGDNGNVYGATAGGYVQLRGGQCGGDGTGGYVEIKGGYSTGGDGGDINIQGGDSSEGNQYHGAVNILTGGHTWSFDNDGKLRLPNSSANGDPVLMIGGGATPGIYSEAGAGPGSFFITANQLLIEGGSSAITMTPDDGEIKASADLVLKTNGQSEPIQWKFDMYGRTTFPANTAPAHSYGAAGDKAGMLAFDYSYIYYCTADYVDNSTHIWVRTAHDQAGTW